MAGTLYVLGTPIGNLGDFSPRAIETLEYCDLLVAEDTRVTVKLLNHFGIKTPIISYHEHNKNEKGPEIIGHLINGKNVAIATDAGMPAISDPGEDLVRLCHKNGILVKAVPGPTAFATAIAVSGFDSRRFHFEGFLEMDKKKRKAQLNSIEEINCTLILYEAPHKLTNTLKDLYSVLGDRKLCIVREITKLHEETIITSLNKAIEDYPDNNLKGEIVLIIEGNKKTEEETLLGDAVEFAKELIEAGLSVNTASKIVSKRTGIKKREIYKELI